MSAFLLPTGDENGNIIFWAKFCHMQPLSLLCWPQSVFLGPTVLKADKKWGTGSPEYFYKSLFLWKHTGLSLLFLCICKRISLLVSSHSPWKNSWFRAVKFSLFRKGALFLAGAWVRCPTHCWYPWSWFVWNGTVMLFTAQLRSQIFHPMEKICFEPAPLVCFSQGVI